MDHDALDAHLTPSCPSPRPNNALDPHLPRSLLPFTIIRWKASKQGIRLVQRVKSVNLTMSGWGSWTTTPPSRRCSSSCLRNSGKRRRRRRQTARVREDGGASEWVLGGRGRGEAFHSGKPRRTAGQRDSQRGRRADDDGLRAVGLEGTTKPLAADDLGDVESGVG